MGNALRLDGGGDGIAALGDRPQDLGRKPKGIEPQSLSSGGSFGSGCNGRDFLGNGFHAGVRAGTRLSRHALLIGRSVRRPGRQPELANRFYALQHRKEVQKVKDDGYGERIGIGKGGMNATLRTLGLAVLAVAIWYLCRYANEPHNVRGIEAPATEFSAARAEDMLARILGPERPHPAGTPENAAVRGRIVAEFAKLGIEAKPYRAMGCNYGARYGAIECATVTDLIAEVKKGEGKAIVLLAHYDSVPAGPGAADDGSGVVSVLETVRALKARGLPGTHPILAVLTDGEEYGLLGAASFLHNPKLKARVGAVVNVEARGNRGPSLLFQTSDGNGPLIDLYAKTAQRYATSSLFVEIYKLLPNDTDLTLFIREGITSFNYAFSENVAHYHTPLDTRANLSRATLQHQGENMLDTATGLANADFASLKGGNDVYLSILGVALPRMPQWLALPLSLLLFVALAFASYMARERKMRWDQQLLSFAMPPVVLVACAFTGWGLYEITQLVSAMPDPTYAYPVTFRVALSFAIAGIVLTVSAMAPRTWTCARGMALARWARHRHCCIRSGHQPVFPYPIPARCTFAAASRPLAQSLARAVWPNRAAARGWT